MTVIGSLALNAEADWRAKLFRKISKKGHPNGKMLKYRKSSQDDSQYNKLFSIDSCYRIHAPGTVVFYRHYIFTQVL